MNLGAFLLLTGHHIAAWRHPDASTSDTLDDFIGFARIAEDAKFDAVFLSDGVVTRFGRDPGAASRVAHNGTHPFEPLTLLSALACATSKIGLIGTASTTYSEPFNLARQFSSLDRLSRGRAGWNLVTTSDPDAARNFGLDEDVLHASRYERAQEFCDVVKGLWNSWDGDAFIRDRESGRYFDPEKVRWLDHHGKHFSVQGPLNTPRSPQGHPVIVQAGSSEAGKELAARTAEVVFTAQQTLEDAVTFYADLKGRLGRYGRSRESLKIMPGVLPVIGRTESEAQEKFEELQSLIEPEVGLNLLRIHLGGLDLSGYPLDGPIPAIPETNGAKSRRELLIAVARKEGLTIRQLYLKIAGARGHWQVVGTPIQIADLLEERFINYGADGFNIMAPTLPGGLTDFTTLVVPELQRRGLFRRDYEGLTLRDHLDLGRPENGSD
jgi:FMN-dependent oxidoreductase (nitrilotriacetate monooxygenase family)